MFIEILLGYLMNVALGIEIPMLFIAGAFALAIYLVWVSDEVGSRLDQYLHRNRRWLYGFLALGVIVPIILGLFFDRSISVTTKTTFNIADYVVMPTTNTLPSNTLDDVSITWLNYGNEVHAVVQNPYNIMLGASATTIIIDDIQHPVYTKWQGHNERFDLIPAMASTVLHLAALGIPEQIKLPVIGSFGWDTCINILLSDGQTNNRLPYASYGCLFVIDTDDILITIEAQLTISVWALDNPESVLSRDYHLTLTGKGKELSVDVE